MFLLYAAIALNAYYLEKNPPVGDIKDFSYEVAKSNTLRLIIGKEEYFIFARMTEGDFNERKSYYYSIAVAAQKENIPDMIFESCIYIFIYIVGLVIHLNILRNIRKSSSL